MFLVADRLWGRRVAYTSAGIAAVYPPLVLMNAGLLTEPLFIVLELGMLLAVLAARRAGPRRALALAAAAGVLCGLAALTRANGALLAIPAAIGLWAVRPRVSLR